MATSGAAGAVIWPMRGANGPMGEQAAEIGHREGSERLKQRESRAFGYSLSEVARTGVWRAADFCGRDYRPSRSVVSMP